MENTLLAARLDPNLGGFLITLEAETAERACLAAKRKPARMC